MNKNVQKIIKSVKKLHSYEVPCVIFFDIKKWKYRFSKMDYKIRIVRYLYYFSLIGLLILYLFPGSLIGYFFYGDFERQPDMIPNPIRYIN